MPAHASSRLAVVAVTVAVALAATAPPSWAHADLERAAPSAGTGLPQAPGAVVLRFSEPLDLRLSRIVVVDAHGREADTGPTRPVVGDARGMQRRLRLLQPGTYLVRWTSVSREDGHVLRGSYAFGVGVAPLADSTAQAGPTATEGWLGLAGRLLGLLGLLLWVGLAALGSAVPRTGVSPGAVTWLKRAAPAAALVGFVLAAVATARVATGSIGAVGNVLTSSRSGTWRLALLVVCATGVLAAIRSDHALARGRLRRGIEGVLVGAALIAEAASGHAAAASHPPRAVAAVAVHLAAAGVWLTAITLGVLAGRDAAAALRVLTPPAIGAAGVVAATGVANAGAELASASALTGTGYGRAVLAKAAVLVAMVGLGATHSVLRRQPRTSLPAIRRAVRGEMVAGLAAVAIATALVGFPNPPRAADEQARPVTVSPLAALGGGRPAVTVAQPDGPFVVGVVLSPPRPGRVRVDVEVVGAEPGDALRDARLTFALAHAVPGRRPPAAAAALRTCGFGCFTGSTTLPAAGAWRFTLQLTSNRGGISVADTVPLPAPDGRALLARIITGMQRLRSARMHETLRAAADRPPIVTDYTFAAPDRMRFDVAGAGSTVEIGARSYLRDTPTGRWRSFVSGAPFRWPAGYYAEFFGGAVAVRILSADPAGRTTVVAFARPDVDAWFRLTVDSRTGLLRTMDMRADGHLMDQTYLSYDASGPVTAPR